MSMWFWIVVIFLWPVALSAQPAKPTTIAELVTYDGKDREQILYGGAKAEGKITWYTSLAGDSYKGMVKAFETKYPGIKVEAYRVSGSEMTTRMKNRRPEDISSTPSKPPKVISCSCATPFCCGPIIRHISNLIRKTPRKKESAACISGRLRASHTSALPTTPSS